MAREGGGRPGEEVTYVCRLRRRADTPGVGREEAGQRRAWGRRRSGTRGELGRSRCERAGRRREGAGGGVRRRRRGGG